MKLVITLAAIVGLANVAALPYALDTSNDADRARIATVKADNQDTLADINDDASYYASEQYKTVKAANESLKRIKEGEL